MNNTESFKNLENPEDIFIKTNITYTELQNNIIHNNQEDLSQLKTASDFNLYHLIRIKKFSYNNSVFGIVHIQLKYFQKQNNYDSTLNILDQKIQKALEVSQTNSGINKLFILLDLSNITQRNYSRKFMKLLAERFNVKYDDCMALCYIYGNLRFVKILWPFITTLIEKKTKKKLVLVK